MEPAATILVVDDDAKNVRLMEMLLRPRGYAVVTASNGAAVLQQVQRAQPDLMPSGRGPMSPRLSRRP